MKWYSGFLEALRRLFASRKFLTALAAWLTALAALITGTITQADFLNATITLALAVIGGIAVEDAARNFSGGPEQLDPPEKVGPQ